MGYRKMYELYKNGKSIGLYTKEQAAEICDTSVKMINKALYKGETIKGYVLKNTTKKMSSKQQQSEIVGKEKTIPTEVLEEWDKTTRAVRIYRKSKSKPLYYKGRVRQKIVIKW